MSYVDLLVDRTHDLPNNIYMEIDGPSHYYINRQPAGMKKGDSLFINASTEFRNRLYELNNISLHVIPYVDIDSNMYRSALVSVLERYPESFWDAKQSESSKLEIDYADKPMVSIPGELKGSAQKPGASKKKNDGKKKENKQKSKQSKELEDADFEAALQEFKFLASEMEAPVAKSYNLEVQYNNLRDLYSKKRSRYKAYNLLFIAIIEKDLPAVETLLEYYTNKKTPHELESFLLNGKSKSEGIGALEFTLKKFSEGKVQEDVYLDIWSLIYSYASHMAAPLNDYSLKGLLASFATKKVEAFNNFLNLLPGNEAKNQLMEFFFINYGASNNVEIAKVLLDKGIDMNACYSRESVEVLYALAFGKRHNGKVLPQDLNTLLMDGITRVLLSTSKKPNFIEELLQDGAGGSMDKAAGVPQGRGVTALHLSCYGGEECNEIRQLLLNANANLNTLNGRGFTPFMTTLVSRHEGASLQLLEFKPIINLMLDNNITALHLAVTRGYNKVVSKMLSMGCDSLNIEAQDGKITGIRGDTITFYKGETPLRAAMRCRMGEVIQVLLKAKPDKVNFDMPLYPKDSTSADDLVPSISYIIIFLPWLVADCIEAGMDINVTNNKGGSGLA